MLLCHIPYATPSEQLGRHDRGHTVERVIYDPVEHLDQEGKALQYATVYMVPEPRSVWRCDFPAKYAPNLWCARILRRVNFVVFAVAVGW
jgi:hypothetical protein